MPYRQVGFTESRITGSGSWNFGSYRREDIVEIYGSKGKITFSVFENDPLLLTNDEGETKLIIEHRKHSIIPCEKMHSNL
jgi:hypothetical protein